MASEDARVSWFRMKDHDDFDARDERWPWAQWHSLKNWNDACFELRRMNGVVGVAFPSRSVLKFYDGAQQSIRAKLFSPDEELVFDLKFWIKNHPTRSVNERHWLLGEGKLADGQTEVLIYVYRLGDDPRCKELRKQNRFDPSAKYCRRLYIELYLKKGTYLGHQPFNTTLTPGKGFGAVDLPFWPERANLDGYTVVQDDAGTGYEREP